VIPRRTPQWLPKILKRIHELAASDQYRLTFKAQREVHVLDLAPEDVRDVLESLSTEDFTARLVSRASGEWMYVFKPDVGGQIIYVKVLLREHCLVVSFHEDEGADHEEAE
jgi:hypothetical protein